MPLSDNTGSTISETQPSSCYEESHEDVLLARKHASGDAYANGCQSSGQRATGKMAGAVIRAKSESKPSIRLVFRSCRSALERALGAEADLIERANALSDLRDSLEDLWQYNELREEQFGRFIVLVQGLLLDVDDLPRENIEAISQVIEKASNRETLTEPDLKEFIRILLKAGCHVFRELL